MVLPVKSQDLLGNKLLAALPGEEYERILPCLERVSFSFGKSIYESSERPNHAYFPTTSVVSLVYDMVNGASAEIGMVGNEGLIGGNSQTRLSETFIYDANERVVVV